MHGVDKNGDTFLMKFIRAMGDMSYPVDPVKQLLEISVVRESVKEKNMLERQRFHWPDLYRLKSTLMKAANLQATTLLKRSKMRKTEFQEL